MVNWNAHAAVWERINWWGGSSKIIPRKRKLLIIQQRTVSKRVHRWPHIFWYQLLAIFHIFSIFSLLIWDISPKTVNIWLVLLGYLFPLFGSSYKFLKCAFLHLAFYTMHKNCLKAKQTLKVDKGKLACQHLGRGSKADQCTLQLWSLTQVNSWTKEYSLPASGSQWWKGNAGLGEEEKQLGTRALAFNPATWRLGGGFPWVQGHHSNITRPCLNKPKEKYNNKEMVK